MQIVSCAKPLQYSFVDVGMNQDTLLGEGVHISFDSTSGPVNLFMDARNAVNLYFAMQRSIAKLKAEGNKSTLEAIYYKENLENFIQP